MGLNALLDFQVNLTLDGAPLTAAEIQAILAETSSLTQVRGQWVQVDAARLQTELARLQGVQSIARARGLPFVEALRLVAGAGLEDNAASAPDPEWSAVVGGPWLAARLADLRAPDGLAVRGPPPGLKGRLRPYQLAGLRWLSLVTGLGLGACLADDMGLGKTLQVLALLLARRSEGIEGPSLLVSPTSLMANWVEEAGRFAPGLKLRVVHSSAMSARDIAALDAPDLDGYDLVITTYGSLLRQSWPRSRTWDLLILDEAQAIKNPAAKQSKAAKKLRAHGRVALTGTPIENRLSDLWSLYDLLNPGLLGSAKAFAQVTRRLAETGDYSPLRNLVQPTLLRRLKTDKNVIADLPDKTEVRAYCNLSTRQAALYGEAVADLAQSLQTASGIARRGLVLSSLMRLKQICNHPSQWLGDGAWEAADSGKWARLQEICEVVAARQEKLLVFTQFREVIEPLVGFLGGLFGRPGLHLHGQTSVRQRKERVRQFQEDESVPFFVLSLKAGGSGLNLTAASHVVHFDRWWNPAVEEQATDRAYRIGQHRNVLVHKFLCKGTIEDAIDRLIESKRQLSHGLLEGGAELDLTSMSNEDLLRLVRLDLHSAASE